MRTRLFSYRPMPMDRSPRGRSTAPHDNRSVRGVRAALRRRRAIRDMLVGFGLIAATLMALLYTAYRWLS